MKRIPEFKNEAEESEFWSKADSTEYVDWSHARRVKLVNLKPTLLPTSLPRFESNSSRPTPAGMRPKK